MLCCITCGQMNSVYAGINRVGLCLILGAKHSLNHFLGHTTAVEIRSKALPLQRTGDLLDSIHFLQPWETKQREPCNSEYCVENINHIARPISNATERSIL